MTDIKSALLYLARGEQPLCGVATVQQLLDAGFARWADLVPASSQQHPAAKLEITLDGLWALTGNGKSILVHLPGLLKEDLQ